MSWYELVAAAEGIRGVAVAADPSLTVFPLVGIGWATVEAERARVELDWVLAPAGARDATVASWTPLERDPALGARGWLRATASPPARPWLVVLEPDTESRLAASLARFGESVAVVYLGEGPVRPGRIVRGGPVWGPHVVILGAAGDPADDPGPPWGGP